MIPTAQPIFSCAIPAAASAPIAPLLRFASQSLLTEVRAMARVVRLRSAPMAGSLPSTQRRAILLQTDHLRRSEHFCEILAAALRSPALHLPLGWRFPRLRVN